MKFVINVTAFPDRCFESNQTLSFCCAGKGVPTFSLSFLKEKSGSVLKTYPLLSGLFFLLMFLFFNNRFQAQIKTSCLVNQCSDTNKIYPGRGVFLDIIKINAAAGFCLEFTSDQF